MYPFRKQDKTVHGVAKEGEQSTQTEGVAKKREQSTQTEGVAREGEQSAPTEVSTCFSNLALFLTS